MALITDYASLQTEVQNWIWRDGDANVAARTPQFIANFEAAFKRRARTLEMQELDTSEALTGAAIELPDGFLEMIRLKMTNLPTGAADQVLTYVTPERASELDTTTTPAGVVRWFTIAADQIVLSPQSWVPSGVILEMLYYSFVPLSDAAPTNWLITKHSDLYLFGSLMQAAAYIDDKDTVAFWKAGHDDALSALLEADKKAKVTGPLVMRPSMGFRTQRQRLPIFTS